MASNGLSIKELFIPLNIHGKKQNAMFYFSCLNTGQSKIQKIEITIMMKKQAKNNFITAKEYKSETINERRTKFFEDFKAKVQENN